jgi:flagellar basal-body rod protein FlgG
MIALSTAATGMAAQELNVNVISNNIANMNTIGFKEQRAQFSDLLYDDIERPGSQSSDTGTIVPTGIQIGTGVQAGSVYRIDTQGSPTQTGNTLDLAIQGSGWFQILLPSGETAYTRAGNFSSSATGQLVTQSGYPVIPAISIPTGSTNITISAAGQVQVTTPGATAPTVVGTLTLATFLNDAGLSADGNNLFSETSASGPPTVAAPSSAGVGSLMQGYTEASNVDSVTEISDLIIAQRAYEMNSKVITTADQMLSTTNQMKS